jgi:uncharacterized protein YkwD
MAALLYMIRCGLASGLLLTVTLNSLGAEDRACLREHRRAEQAAKFNRLRPAGRAQTTGGPGAAAAGREEMEVLKELNLARTDPRAYAKYVQNYRATHQGNRVFRVPGIGDLQTKEGVAAVDEAIAFLERTDPVGALTWSQGLALAAADHVGDIGPKGKVGHDGTDGSTTADRVNRHGKWLRTVGENIALGYADARTIVVQLIIDDGVPNRGHRANIFSRDFGVVGVAIGGHKVFRHMCVLDFAGGFQE